jgi:hypothetical protein
MSLAFVFRRHHQWNPYTTQYTCASLGYLDYRIAVIRVSGKHDFFTLANDSNGVGHKIQNRLPNHVRVTNECYVRAVRFSQAN